MGKKKSVVLMTLLTIVIVVLCAMIVVPTFTLPFLFKGAVSDRNPVVKTYDFGADLGGGYYTYYFPEGVISETEYKRECESKEEDADKLQKYQDSYFKHGGLYLSTDPDDGIVEDDKDSSGNYVVKEEFRNHFKAAAKEIGSRYEKKGYSSFRVSVVDDYALRVELPASEPSTSAGSVITYFSYTGEFTLSDGTSTLFEEGKNVVPADYFKSFSAEEKQGSSYVKVKLTNKGRRLIKEITTTLAASSSSDSSSSPALSFKVGEETVIQLSVTSAIDDTTMYIGGSSYDYETAKTVSVLLDSAVHAGDLGINFKTDEAKTFEPVYGSNALTLLYIALAIVLLAAIVLPIIKYRGFGGAMAYSTLSYFIVTALCFAFITSGIFEFMLGSVLIFLFGLFMTILLNAYIYGAVKSEFETGKTVESSVKAGYKKTLAGVVDVYVVLIGAALALLIGAAGLHTMALQALICFVTGAFCNLLWTRFISHMMLSASKNKYKYFRLVREDDDDE